MTSRRMRVSELRLTSTSVGIASWSRNRWSSDHRAAPSCSPGTAISRRDEQPTPRLLGVDLVPSEEVRVISQELLQEALRVVRSLLHCEQLGIFFQKVDATSHGITILYTIRGSLRISEQIGRHLAMGLDSLVQGEDRPVGQSYGNPCSASDG